MENYYIPILTKLEADWEKRIEDLKVLKTMCTESISVEKFLSNLSLEPPNPDKFGFQNKDTVEEYVTILTIHSAKGLEWNTVFIIYLIEERKLFYVACSRTKENLYLSAPHYSQSYSGFFDRMSRFISEIDPNNYQLEEFFFIQI